MAARMAAGCRGGYCRSPRIWGCRPEFVGKFLFKRGLTMAAVALGDSTERRTIGSTNMTLLIAAAVLLVMAIGGTTLIVRFVDSEWQRELRAWQIRLGIVADSRIAAVDGLLDRQFDALAGLGGNGPLQLYMTHVATLATTVDGADLA